MAEYEPLLVEILVEVMDPSFVCSVSLARCLGLAAAWMERGGAGSGQTCQVLEVRQSQL